MVRVWCERDLGSAPSLVLNARGGPRFKAGPTPIGSRSLKRAFMGIDLSSSPLGKKMPSTLQYTPTELAYSCSLHSRDGPAAGDRVLVDHQAVQRECYQLNLKNLPHQLNVCYGCQGSKLDLWGDFSSEPRTLQAHLHGGYWIVSWT